MFVIIASIIIFLAGLYFYTSKESMQSGKNCPTTLIQKDGKLYLNYPDSSTKVFNNLEEYISYRSIHNKECPVLFLQNTYDTQGKSVYKIRPGPTNLHGGLPPSNIHLNKPPTVLIDNNVSTDLIDAGHSDLPYNENSMPGFDPNDFYVGKKTPLDVMNEKQEALLHSPDPMDNNWGGQFFTQQLIDKGYYKDNEITKNYM